MTTTTKRRRPAGPTAAQAAQFESMLADLRQVALMAAGSLETHPAGFAGFGGAYVTLPARSAFAKWLLATGRASKLRYVGGLMLNTGPAAGFPARTSLSLADAYRVHRDIATRLLELGVAGADVVSYDAG